MLFYGISLIMKEKSNASALIWEQRQPNQGAGTTESGSRHDRIWEQARPNQGAETTESGSRDDRIWDGVRQKA